MVAYALGACTFGACQSANRYKVGALGDEPKAADAGSGGTAAPSAPSFPQTGINSSTLTVTGVSPSSGPFGGGNLVTVRGSGFTADALVYIGGRLVQPANTQLQDRNSLVVVVPAGRSGTVDVRVDIGDRMATLPDGYQYNALALEPVSGSIAGGTSVTISTETPQFGAGDMEVDFGGVSCTDLQVITPSQARCKTPPAQSGAVDVRLGSATATGEPPIVATAAYEYVDVTDIDRGGLSGGSIAGTVNVTVIDTVMGLVVPDAFVLLGDAPMGMYQGRTDERGEITFSGNDLRGPVSIHVVAKCMERASIIAFDAANVTVHVDPVLDPACADAGGSPPASGRGTAGSFISGQLIFGGKEEFSPLAWDAVPAPRTNEARVAYIFTTRSSPLSSNPTPGLNGTLSRVVESSGIVGDKGYLYRIFARPAALAVYAIAGVERNDTGQFVPYVMGIARGVLTAPGQEAEDVDITMNMPLDRELQVQLSNLPSAVDSPKFFRVAAYLDLGAEGALVRQINGKQLDVSTALDAGKPFNFFAQPALRGGLSDARYGLTIGWYSGDDMGAPPYTELRRTGFAQSDDVLQISDLLPIPEVVAPVLGDYIPADRVLRWQQAGTPPDMFVVTIQGGDGLPAWTQIVPGTQTQSAIPDLSGIDGLTDIAPGAITWQVRAVRIDGFLFNEFKYNLLLPRMWTHTSIDAFLMRN